MLEELVATDGLVIEAADAVTRTAYRGRSGKPVPALRQSCHLTLAAPRVNHHQKSGKDAEEWLPRNPCWFAVRIMEVRRVYGLTIDLCEAEHRD